jgi:hypothetical protein
MILRLIQKWTKSNPGNPGNFIFFFITPSFTEIYALFEAIIAGELGYFPLNSVLING